MIALRAQWSAYVDQQHRYPTGVIGRVIGERMRRQHTPETEWSIELLQIKPSDRVLEIGFGVGRGLALTLQQAIAGHVTGIDVSATMIQAATQRNRAALAHGQLSLLRGDIAALPFGNQQFDKIFSIHTFYFWPDPRAICQQLINLLAQRGRVVSTFATAQTLPNRERVHWPIHEHAEALVREVQQQANIAATLAYGPDSRQYNNVAIVIDKC
jgi:ubiquinone/menaquinone biosynthesis C-methylase UbiE